MSVTKIPVVGAAVNFNKYKIQKSNSSPGLQAGVGMIEILITLFIITIGLLGVAYLQFVGSFTNSEALSRSQSVMVAQQLSERLRANAVKSLTGDGFVVHNNYFNSNLYNFSNLGSCGNASPHQCFCLALPTDIPNCRSTVCSAADFAVFDAYEVSCSAAASMASIDLALSCDDNNTGDLDTCSVGSRHSIILAWPVEKWQDIDRTLNPRCNAGKQQPHDCVISDVTL
jgi:type IV pilus assembly protein PilV